MTKEVLTEGEARLLLRAFLKHTAKNFKKCLELDDDKVTAAVLIDFTDKFLPFYNVAMALGGYELPEEKEKINDLSATQF
jgi:hypothetical protein